MARIVANWDRALAANHVSNVPPNQQANWDLGRQYIIAGIDAGMPNDGYHANAWYSVTGGSSFSVPPFKTASKATPNNGSDYPLGMVLYGNVGTDEEGWIYDPSVKKWYKDVANIPGATGAGEPPGPDGFNPLANASPEQVYEFTVTSDGDYFWTAKTPSTSARNNDKNPHRGISIINSDQWDKVAGGLSAREALDLDSYKDAGWTGLDHKFLGWQDDGTVQPAGEELSSAMDAATDNNDAGALRALRSVGVNPPKQKKISGLLSDFGF